MKYKFSIKRSRLFHFLDKFNRTQNRETMVDKIVLCIIAFFLPPLAVYLHQNSCNQTTLINLILTILFWLPGIIFIGKCI